MNNAGLAVDVPYLDTALALRGTAQDAATPLGVSPAEAVALLRGPLLGLDLCHKRGILHRDFKPANLFLTETADALLGDFGAAAVMDAAGEAKAGGDPDLRAPETLKGAPHTRQADVYAAGLTLYALLTGALPHSIALAGSFPTHKAKVLAGMTDIRDAAPHVGVPLTKVVRRATAPRPTERYRTAADLDAALGALPTARRTVNRIQEHVGHDRCWEAVDMSGHVITVCAWGHEVAVRHAASGNKMSALCKTLATNKAVLGHLRKAFMTLQS